MAPHNDKEHPGPLSGLTLDELQERLRQAVEATERAPKDPRKQTLAEYLNEQEETDSAADSKEAGNQTESW